MMKKLKKFKGYFQLKKKEKVKHIHKQLKYLKGFKFYHCQYQI